MERIKLPKRILFPLLISIILFILPFFWLKPGEMDLGGDSSRLYFYDPVAYLFSASLYVVSPSSFGVGYLNFGSLPLVSILIFLKSIFSSPTTLISIFHGFSLSTAFIFCFLTIKELINEEDGWCAAVVGGLLYILSPAFIGGWAHVLVTHNQIFLNPMIFYLLLRYFKTSNLNYIYVSILTTFIFSANFSVAGAPGFFAFYPLSILFLIVYTKFVLRKKILVTHLILGLLLFVGVQAFHLISQGGNIFFEKSDINSTIFSDQGKFNRGLNYFSAIAPNIKLSINLLGLIQMQDLSFFSRLFLFFPFIIVGGLFYNYKKRTILLTSIFFFITLLFATANITNIWLSFYKSLFAIPGFSMFRNFYGQWQSVYIFFYSILFGQALYILSSRLSKVYSYLFIFLITLVVVIDATPFLTGDLMREILWQSKNVSAVIQIDPDYKKALSFVRSLPIDGRVLTLPLTDPGYQIIAGKNKGAYMGPSTIAYLGGKKDFAGFDELEDYRDLILNLIRDGQFETLKKILGILNIRYIFYDADPLVYDSFPSFPYQHVRDFLPQNQNSYRDFIQKLKVREIKNINNKFFVFELSENYLPQINIADRSINFNKSAGDIQVPLALSDKSNRIAIYNSFGGDIDSRVKFDEQLIDVQNMSSFSSLINSTNPALFGFPFASWSMGSPIYPFIVSHEKKEIKSYQVIDQTFIDRGIFLAEKRIAELEKFGKNTSVLGQVKSIESLNKTWREPGVLEAIIFGKYNYWEIGLLRYYRAVNELIDKIENVSKTDKSFVVNKDRVERAISIDKEVLYRTIHYDENLSKDQIIYLLKLSINMFNSISDRLQFDIPSLEKTTYRLNKLEDGKYDMYIDKKSIQNYNQSKLRGIINDKEFLFEDFQQDANWSKVQSFYLTKSDQNKLTILTPEPSNLVSDSKWESVEKGTDVVDATSLSISDMVSEQNGFTREITNWQKTSYYLVSLDYFTYGKGFKLMIFNRRPGVSSKQLIILNDELRSNKWKSYKAIIASSDDANSAFLQIFKPSGNELLSEIEPKGRATKIDIKNLSIVQIPNPKLILRKSNTVNAKDKGTPRVTFKRINPTKYEIKIEDAMSPYTLVLANKFNQNWKLINPAKNEKNMQSFFLENLGNVGRAIASIFKKNHVANSNQLLSYFDGQVNEIFSKDVFLDNNTFETWGKSEVAREKHFPVNGYSNAWYIEPKDVQGKKNYILILEMATQKVLYVSLLISLITVIVSFLLLVKGLLKNK